jgi:enoyl-CoA hydratase/carnithine racemase
VPGRGLLLARRLLPVERERKRYPRSIADGPQIPIRMIKRLVYQSMRLDLRTHLDLVSSHMGLVRQTSDHKEGVQAFKDKRPPKFTGR